jgi:dual specificity MAP kinase phosphatase
MVIQGVQDNGIDPLTDEFENCLEFIGMLKAQCPCPVASFVGCRIFCR